MFLINGFKAQLRPYNREASSAIFDDKNFGDLVDIKLCPYDGERKILFSKYTVSEAKGYYTVPGNTDVRVGDQILFEDKTMTVIEVGYNYLFNKIENYTLAVK